MKALLRDGAIAMPRVEDVPLPAPRPGYVLVRTCASLVSGGTERAVAEFAGLSLARKAARRPDLVRQVIDKVKRDGIWETQASVRSRLGTDEPLGYSCAGIVQQDGTGRHPVGSLVACAGGGHATHAEYNLVPQNLVASVPPAVPAELAAFATVGAVAMHAVRLAEVALGENVAVIGLGLIGQIAAQLLKAAGCTVFGFDPNAARSTLATELGCDFAGSDADAFRRELAARTGSRGADAVLIAAATRDGGPLALATDVARGRARIVVLGDTGLHADRRAFYEKELRLVVSQSYGPGRYDRGYEEGGLDYPYEYVRWTQQRNVEAFLQLTPRLRLEPLVTHRFPIAQAVEAYKILLGERAEPYLGIVLEYPEADADAAASRAAEEGAARRIPLSLASRASATGDVGVSLIGVGNYARATLLPALAKVRGLRRVAVVSAKGLSAREAGTRFGFEACSTDLEDAFGPSTDLVIAATRHSQHAALVRQALGRGKAIFVEKPLCVSEAELDAIVAAYHEASQRPFLVVGYNRRFAPLVVKLKEWLAGVGRPLILNYRVNAGALPTGSWLLDPSEGEGRIVGEACHFLDLIVHLAGAPVERVHAVAPVGEDRVHRAETVVVVVELANGSVGNLVYSAEGDPAHPKERLEIIGGGAVAILEDFRSLLLTHRGRSRRTKTWRRDKGHAAELEATVAALKSAAGEAPIPFDEIVNGMRATFAVRESLCTQSAVTVGRSR